MKKNPEQKKSKSFIFFVEPSLYEEYRVYLSTENPDASVAAGLRNMMREYVKKRKEAERKSISRSISL